jgi:hypothetical protein
MDMRHAIGKNQTATDALLPVQRADHAPAALVQNVGVDHRGGNIGMPEQLLHGAYVVAGFEQVSSK